MPPAANAPAAAMRPPLSIELSGRRAVRSRSFRQAPTWRPGEGHPRTTRETASALRRMLAQPDASFLLEPLALLVAEDLYPKIPTAQTVAALDGLERELRARIGSTRDGRKVVAILNDFLFKKMGFRASRDLADPRIRLLSWVAVKRSGQCLGLTTLYLVLAERLGLPARAVELPSHVFPRYDDGRFRCNIETLENGKLFTDAAARVEFRTAPGAVERGVYLRSLTRKEFAAIILDYRSTVLSKRRQRMGAAEAGFILAAKLHPRSPLTRNNMGNHYYRLRRLDRAIEYYRKAVELDPNLYTGYCNLASAYYRQGLPRKAIGILEQAVTKDPRRPTAHYNLGIIYDTELRNRAKALFHYYRFLEVGGRNPNVKKWMLQIVSSRG